MWRVKLDNDVFGLITALILLLNLFVLSDIRSDLHKIAIKIEIKK
jgi:hypothetical protein